jgi:hypothetical protein
MSSPESTADAADAPTQSAFLRSIEFITGDDPNLGSFLLVVGSVTCVFIALFQSTLPAPVSHLLTGGVLFITVVSGVFASLLDSLGYFDQGSTDADTEEPTREGGRPWVPVGKRSAPLPPMINFDDQLRAYAEMYDDGLPDQFDPFIEDYLRLKTDTKNRATVASDLRADLNPIGALYEEGTEEYDRYEDISERLFRYISNNAEHVLVERMAFYDADGTETSVRDIEDTLGRVELALNNEGEAADVEVTVQFYDAEGGSVSSRTFPAGTIRPAASRTVDAEVFVPAEVVRATATLRVSEPNTPNA